MDYTERTRNRRNNESLYYNAPGEEKAAPTLIRGSMDYTIYIVVVILVLIGIIMVFSASYLTAATNPRFGDPFFFLKRNLVWAAIGFAAMNFLAHFPYRVIQQFAPIIYAVALFLLGLVLVFGISSNGAIRWLPIPGTSQQFQPSEVAKAAVIFILAWKFHKTPKILHTWPGFIQCSFIVLVATALVGYGGMSSALITALIGFGMIFVASPHILRFVLMGLGGGGAVTGYLWWLANYSEHFRGGRFAAWQNPFEYPLTYGFQVIQSMYAIASGGLFGLGIGQSRQKTFLPEAYNDIIFAIICEELGLIGAATILLLFGIFIWRGLRIALNALDTFSAMTAIGIVFAIAGQVVINVAVVTNSIPNTGVTLPFISFGGTSLVICMSMAGVLLNISKYSKESM
jgi:cell division protein FtsW